MQMQMQRIFEIFITLKVAAQEVLGRLRIAFLLGRHRSNVIFAHGGLMASKSDEKRSWT